MVGGQMIEHEDGDDGALSTVSAQTMEIATSRQVQEVQAAMIVARKFPRDQLKAIARIVQECKRRGVAELSTYEYKRGGTLITGPSIRLAEVMARNWGNIDFGVVELERRRGESVSMAYCWDLETNVRQTKIFTVRHNRDTKDGGYALKDERDIYEHVANNAARRLRACILGIIPGDVQDEALRTCDATLQGETTEPIADRIKKMVLAFLEMGISADMLAAKLGHSLDGMTLREIAKMQRVYASIRDGIASVEEHFAPARPAGDAPKKATLDSLADKQQRAADPAPSGAAPSPPAPATTPATEPATSHQPANGTELSLWDKFVAELTAAEPAAKEAVRDKWFGPDSTIEWTQEQAERANSLYLTQMTKPVKSKRDKTLPGV